MKIYLASRYSRREELCAYRRQLEAVGHVVTSRWLNGTHQISDSGVPIDEEGKALIENEGDDGSESKETAVLRVKFAHQDIHDLGLADTAIFFTEPPRSTASRGGRHVEFGVALARRRRHESPRLIVVGHRENIFNWLPSVEFFATWEAALDALTP